MNARLDNNFVSDRDTALKETVFRLMMKKGVKGMTMDDVAAEFGISKRTLYEKFSGKLEMVKQVLEMQRSRHHALYQSYLEQSANVMEAAMRMFKLQREFLLSLNPGFFQEMDELFPELRESFENNSRSQRDYAMRCFALGVEQGVYRPDVNYGVLLTFQGIQFEALKRMENAFPPDISIGEVYETMFILMLRSIATAKGLEILEHYLADLRKGNMASETAESK